MAVHILFKNYILNVKMHLLLKTVFHYFSFVLLCYVSWYGIETVHRIEQMEVVGEELMLVVENVPYYMTHWNMAFQTLFLLLSLVHDVLEWLDKQDCRLAARLRYWRDVVFSGLVVPFTLFVSSMFWCVYAVDRELVFPRAYDDVVPWWFNHCVHTNISVVVLIETLLQARRRPRDFKTEIIAVTVVDVAYAIVYYAIYFFTHRWLYKVFGVMTWWQVCLYQLVIWGSSYLFYFLQFPINRVIHGDVEETDNAATGQVTEQMINGTKEMNEDKTDTDAKISSLSKNPWSLKYRSNGSKIENSHL
ncbi:PREDICTED: androgen-dependent TFPI-regulating protein-like isoform X3 [Papilio xuthus]|uniref:Androgen-dependent TFPI-regulating protein-like isoform X3 n=1 Tax=Papilio xuthus TaxID=66420 RepID=A0AAJ6ZQJ0_PAPXU|nr:PREDICTED: androgen-dependent TFPI-regulating protein-like isoform X3 [Papilio xuthus]